MVNRWVVLLLVVFFTASCAKKAEDAFETPRRTYELWLDASMKGDIPTNLKCLTKDSQKFMNFQVKNRDIFISRMVQSAAIFKNYSVTEERTKGDKAVLIILEPKSGNTIQVPLKYEEGWKVDLIAMFGRQEAK